MSTFTFNKFGWSELLALGALAVSIFSYFDSRGARADAKEALSAARPNIIVEKSYEAFDSTELQEKGFGTLVWYVRYSFMNQGGSSASLRGMWNDSTLPIVLGIHDGNAFTENINTSIYSDESIEWRDIVNNDDYFSERTPVSSELLADINLEIPAGQSKSLAFAYVIESKENTVEEYWINYKFIFSDGTKHKEGSIIKINP
ncbi:hypothetical protein K6675_004555 [Vibrio parahaemolyticus]|uniref:hypothetical protein n=1 Tax=Vibrio parahaemolyticus TaxID=670 RepID=UPI0006A7379B|nr:hypothetical protein [Vibrio parahaemolyticus]EHK2865781.1 hypothetical protein [Vibrio parahaemolyticus]EHK9101365.1 hypothetical protein [Vibrio parahaemolyticus]EIA1333873.1 hypothetical protein [Vibrio parahaemolyticus]EIT7136892.1 hypothetical protein [Vibrio parahaemolyticus]EIV8628392.1 hypothetical protein [Vibrio parahaemolyticus]